VISLVSLVYPTWCRLHVFLRRLLRAPLRVIFGSVFGRYATDEPARPDEPNSAHIVRNLQLNYVGGLLVTRLYPVWQSLPDGVKRAIRVPAVAVIKVFRTE